MTLTVYPPSSPADRARETERAIANVRAEIPPADQAQTLRDLKRGADGEPQLDEDMLEREARIVAEADLVARGIVGPLSLLAGMTLAVQQRAIVAVAEAVERPLRSVGRLLGHLQDVGVELVTDDEVIGLHWLPAFPGQVVSGNAGEALAARIEITRRAAHTAGAEALRKQAAQYLEAQAAAIEGEDALAAHVLRSCAGEVGKMVVAEGEGKVEAAKVAANVCEHGDHPAPEGQRFCSKACQDCEHVDGTDDEECAGICSEDGQR